MTEERGEGVYNVVVIGGGTAGLVTAAATAALGGRVALVERDRLGGDCLNTGCVPSKALIASARLAARMRAASRWGFEDTVPRFRFEEVMARVRERRARIAPHDSEERLASLGVHVIRGSARFVAPYEVEVDGGRLRGRDVVIATGSRAAIPAIEGLAEARPYTNETIFDELRERPRRLIVLGGGPIGCELGQALQALGTEVTILEVSPRVLDKEDTDAAEAVRRGLEREGVQVRTGVRARRVRKEGGRFLVELETDGGSERLEGEALLVAAGRLPNTEGLGLEAAGVDHDRRGVKVDERLRTTQAHVYAAGDVAGSYQFTHLADHHARVIVRNMLFPWVPVKVDLRVLPWCTYTTPEVARVGLSEAEAQAKGIACDVWRLDLAEVDRAIVESEEEGFAKVLTAKGTDRILGATLVGAHAGDLIHELVLAMKARLGLRVLAGTIHAYPTWSEVHRKLGDAYQRSRLTPLARRLLEWIQRRRRGA